MHVFAYGTLMFPEIWNAVVGRSFVSVPGHAAGFAIYRVRDAVFPGICTDSQSVVPGVVYFDVDEASVARLDQFEDEFYVRQPVRVVCEDGREIVAGCYVVPDQRRGVLSDEPWTGEDFIARGDLARFIAHFAGFGRVEQDAD